MEARSVSHAKRLLSQEAEGKTCLQQGQVAPSRLSESAGEGLWRPIRWPLASDQMPCSSVFRCGAGSRAVEGAATLLLSVKDCGKWRETHSGGLGTSEQPGYAACDPERDRQRARISILADYMAGWRSGGSGQMKRRRGNSQTWPTGACWSSGHGRHPATRSRGDSTRHGGAPWGLARSSSWWAGVVELGPSVKKTSLSQVLPPALANLDRWLEASCSPSCLEPAPETVFATLSPRHSQPGVRLVAGSSVRS